MVKPVKFAHVVYQTRRFDEMVAWYRDVFEAEVVYENPAFAFLTYDDEHHRFAFANLDVLKPGGTSRDNRGEIGVNHVAYTCAKVGDLMDTYARLKRAGITPYWPVHHGTTLSLYYADPDGNRMEFQVDCGTVQEAIALMRTPAFAANPVGVMYDPDALLARFERPEKMTSLYWRCPADRPRQSQLRTGCLKTGKWPQSVEAGRLRAGTLSRQIDLSEAPLIDSRLLEACRPRIGR